MTENKLLCLLKGNITCNCPLKINSKQENVDPSKMNSMGDGCIWKTKLNILRVVHEFMSKHCSLRSV